MLIFVFVGAVHCAGQLEQLRGLRAVQQAIFAALHAAALSAAALAAAAAHASAAAIAEAAVFAPDPAAVANPDSPELLWAAAPVWLRAEQLQYKKSIASVVRPAQRC